MSTPSHSWGTPFLSQGALALLAYNDCRLPWAPCLVDSRGPCRATPALGAQVQVWGFSPLMLTCPLPDGRGAVPAAIYWRLWRFAGPGQPPPLPQDQCSSLASLPGEEVTWSPSTASGSLLFQLPEHHPPLSSSSLLMMAGWGFPSPDPSWRLRELRSRVISALEVNPRGGAAAPASLHSSLCSRHSLPPGGGAAWHSPPPASARGVRAGAVGGAPSCWAGKHLRALAEHPRCPMG